MFRWATGTDLRGRSSTGWKSLRGVMRCGVMALVTLASGNQGSAQLNVVVVRPKAIHDVLVNPGMGITTFQRFNGQEPNPALKWSKVGPVAKLPQAPTNPDFPNTSISYCRRFWTDLDTEPGQSPLAIVP